MYQHYQKKILFFSLILLTFFGIFVKKNQKALIKGLICFITRHASILSLLLYVIQVSLESFEEKNLIAIVK